MRGLGNHCSIQLSYGDCTRKGFTESKGEKLQKFCLILHVELCLGRFPTFTHVVNNDDLLDPNIAESLQKSEGANPLPEGSHILTHRARG